MSPIRRHLSADPYGGDVLQVRLLNFERPSDAVEYRPPPAPRRPGGSAGSDSRGKDRGLSPERIKEVLRMRVDFQREAIDALDL